MKQSTLIWCLVTVVAFVGFLVLVRAVSPSHAAKWEKTAVGCLPFGHQNVTEHIHSVFSVTVDGAPEVLPANIGITNTCMAEVHTHDASGEVHIESAVSGHTFTLADFYAVWGQGIDRAGYARTVTVNGAPVTDIGAYTMKDSDRILVAYTKQ